MKYMWVCIFLFSQLAWSSVNPKINLNKDSSIKQFVENLCENNERKPEVCTYAYEYLYLCDNQASPENCKKEALDMLNQSLANIHTECEEGGIWSDGICVEVIQLAGGGYYIP